VNIRTLIAASPGWRTRFAPAPTGWLHLGHVVNAVYVWGIARAHDGCVVLRIEDHDTSRCRAEFTRGIFDDLEWLGLVPDEVAPAQSERASRYAAALAHINARAPGAVYPCACSRRDLAQVAGDVFNEETRYSGTCRTRNIDPTSTPARRVVMADGEGDVLVRDRDGQWTYQFAVVVDDIDQRIGVVIRGEDLLTSTARQIQLACMLGRDTPPQFLHHPLVLHDDGSKLSKSNRDTGIRDLRAEGWSAARVLGEAARLGGVQQDSSPIEAGALARLFRE